jgi:23S rRNA pseudouridine2605 synthase
LIRAGHVTVNGVASREVTTNVVPQRDVIAVDGRRLTWPRERRYYAVYKPRGVVSTVRDPHAERTVVQLVPSSSRLYPVGRLDKDSEGLVLLTDDGDFANRVTHPRYEIEKEYRALVRPMVDENTLARVAAGVDLDGRLARPERVDILQQSAGKTWLTVVLTEGRKHEVRRLLGAAGLSVDRLLRIRIGPVLVGELEVGGHRPLTSAEVQELLAGAPTLGRTG